MKTRFGPSVQIYNKKNELQVILVQLVRNYIHGYVAKAIWLS